MRLHVTYWEDVTKLSLNSLTHLFDVVTRLGAGLDEHDTQFFSPLFAFLNCDLSVNKAIF